MAELTAPYGHQGELPPEFTLTSTQEALPKDPLRSALDNLKTRDHHKTPASPEVITSSTQESSKKDQEEPPHPTQSAPPHSTQTTPPQPTEPALPHPTQSAPPHPTPSTPPYPTPSAPPHPHTVCTSLPPHGASHLFPSVQVTPLSENGTAESPQVAPLKEEVEEAAGALNEEMKEAAGGLNEEVEGAAGGLNEEVEGEAGALKEEVEGAAGALKDEVEGAAGALKEVKGAAGALKEEVEGAAGALKEVKEEKEAVSESKTTDGPGLPIIHEPETESECPLAPPLGPRVPAPDSLSYLESASVMSGTMESLSGLDDCSSVGSDSEVNGLSVKRTDKYGFLGGNQYSESGEKEVRVEVSRQREMKWLDMFNHWDKWVKHRFQKVKMRCRKGVPSSLRAKAWQLLSNSQELLEANPGKFEELEREPGEAKWLDIIEKDLHRQFPFHEMFAARGGHGQQDLFRILKAYTVYRPEEGYCQAQAPVAAVLLMHMPAEQAFWCLVQICEKYLPGYYSAGLEAIQLDGEVFFSLLRRTSPMAYRHLKKFKIDPILYMTEWFMCIYSRTLPWSSVLRVWDMFFCEGVKIVFRVGLVLLKQMLGSVEKLRELQGMYETMERLRNIAPDMIKEEVLVQEIVTLPITESLIERECGVQVKKWRESRGALTHEPGRRLHGTRHVYEHKRRASSLASGGSFSFLSSSAPPPGPLRASSSLLSLPGFRRSKPFYAQPKKASFSGPSIASPPQSPPAMGNNSNKPPLPPGKSAHVQSPLASSGAKGETHANKPHANEPHANEPHANKPHANEPHANEPHANEPHANEPHANKPHANKSADNALQANTLSPRVVSEQITPQIPSPTANNAPLLAADLKSEEEEAKKGGKKSKEERKKKEKEEERRRQKEKRDREKAEKERSKKEKERQERERKRSGKKKTGGAEEAGGAAGGAAAKDRV